MYKWFALFCFLPAIAHARYYPAKGPFPMRTQHPVYLQMVQLTPAKAEVLPTGNFEVRVDSSYSNLYERQTDGVNAINLDMELWYLNWVATYGLLPNLEVGLELPLIHFGTGFLDSFIQNYHNAFGFPNGGRDQVQNGLFTYRITRRWNGEWQRRCGSWSSSAKILQAFARVCESQLSCRSRQRFFGGLDEKTCLRFCTGG